MLQVALFCGIPIIYWFVRRRRETPLRRYLGLVAPRKTANVSQIAVFSLGYIAVYVIVHFIPTVAALTQPSASAYEGMGVAAIIPAILVCFVQQALSEEVLFRGFIGKRLNSLLGFAYGNVVQAVIFSGAHVLLSVSETKGPASYLIIFTSIALGGWLLGYLNERLCGGSLVPSILLHGLGNYIMILSQAF